jgi:hypothetical protein
MSTVETVNDWIVNVKGNPEQRMWEVSIVKRHNLVGRNAFGQWSSEKIMISKSDGFSCNLDVWDGLFALATHHCIFLNRRDGYEEPPEEIVKEAVAEKKAVKKKAVRRKK